MPKIWNKLGLEVKDEHRLEQEQGTEREQKIEIKQGIKYKHRVDQDKIMSHIPQLNTDSYKKCTICGRIFSLTGNLNVHMAAMHAKKEDKLKCSKIYCNKMFGTMYDMKDHKRLFAFQYDDCGVQIVKGYRVKGHIRKCSKTIMSKPEPTEEQRKQQLKDLQEIALTFKII